MSDLNECVRNALENALLVNDALNDKTITQGEYNHEIENIVHSTSMEIKQIQNWVEIL